MGGGMETHYVKCKTPEALAFLKKEWVLLGLWSEKEKPMTVGDAMVAKDSLLEAGFEWGKDFYLLKK